MESLSEQFLKIDIRKSTHETFSTDLCDSQDCAILHVSSHGAENTKENVGKMFCFDKFKGDFLLLEDTAGEA